MSVANIAIVIGAVVTLLTAAGGLFKALTTRQSDLEKRQGELVRDRTNRLIRLEEYVDADILFHRKFRAAILAQLQSEGSLVDLDMDTLPQPPGLPPINGGA